MQTQLSTITQGKDPLDISFHVTDLQKAQKAHTQLSAISYNHIHY